MNDFRVLVVFRDGMEMPLLLPEDARHMETFSTGRPDRLENVDVSFESWRPNGIAVYRETD